MRYLFAIALCAAPGWGQAGPATGQKVMIPPPRASAVAAACLQPAMPVKGPVKTGLRIQPGVEVTLDPLTVSQYLSPSFPYNVGLRFDFAPVVGGVSGTPKPFPVAAGTSTEPALQKQSFPLPPGNYELYIWGGSNGSPKYTVTVKACTLGPAKSTLNPNIELK